MFNDKNNSEVKERILAVSRHLFIKNGYNSTSVRDIASASDTNVAMVNYYFHSKYNLFEIIFEDALEVLLNRILKVINSDKPIFELISSWIDAYYETMLEYPQIPIFILNAVNQNPQSLSKIIQKYQPYEIFLKITERFDQEIEKGNIRETPSLDFLLNIFSLCVFPFIFGNLATNVAGVSQEEYTVILENHKHYVKEFVINALKNYEL